MQRVVLPSGVSHIMVGWTGLAKNVGDLRFCLLHLGMLWMVIPLWILGFFMSLQSRNANLLAVKAGNLICYLVTTSFAPPIAFITITALRHILHSVLNRVQWDGQAAPRLANQDGRLTLYRVWMHARVRFANGWLMLRPRCRHRRRR